MFSRLILEYLLRSFLREEEFRSLNIKSFQGSAHTKRTDTFVDYLKNKTPLPLVKGGEPVIVNKVEITRKDSGEGADSSKPTPVTYDPTTQSDELKEVLPLLNARDKLILIDASGRRYSITSVAKTRELGGKGKGGTLGPERAAIASLQKQLDDIGAPITVMLKGFEPFKGITNVINVKENQKADFALAAGDTPVLFISYKPGNSAKGVISYGGITGESEKNSAVIDFIAAVKSKVTDFEGLGYEFGAPMPEGGEEVALRAMYGSNYGSGQYGINNVHAIMQGDIKLVEKSEGVYELTGDHVMISSEIPDGPYTPYLNARYAGDRSQFGIKHARVGVVPMDARKNIRNPFDEKTATAK